MGQGWHGVHQLRLLFVWLQDQVSELATGENKTMTKANSNGAGL